MLGEFAQLLDSVGEGVLSAARQSADAIGTAAGSTRGLVSESVVHVGKAAGSARELISAGVGSAHDMISGATSGLIDTSKKIVGKAPDVKDVLKAVGEVDILNSKTSSSHFSRGRNDCPDCCDCVCVTGCVCDWCDDNGDCCDCSCDCGSCDCDPC